jgi:hypothetical protein
MKSVTILVGTVGQSIMRSEDNEHTWMRIGPRRGFPYEASVRCLAVHPRGRRGLPGQARPRRTTRASGCRSGTSLRPRSPPPSN